MMCIRFFGIQIMDILQVKRTRYLAKFLQRNANAMSDNHKEYVYAIIAKYDRHNRTDRFSCQNQNVRENSYGCV